MPGLTPSLFVGNEINLTANQAMIDFVGSITAGLVILAAQVNPSNPYENDITAVGSTKKSFRK